MQATMQGHKDIVEVLLLRGANSKAVSTDGRTADALAILMGRKVGTT